MFARILVTGKVQGVGFRNFVRVTAKYGNVKGLVRNLKDGTVEIFTDAEEADIKKLVEKLKLGNQTSKVEKVELFGEESEGYKEAWRDYNNKFMIDGKWGE